MVFQLPVVVHPPVLLAERLSVPSGPVVIGAKAGITPFPFPLTYIMPVSISTPAPPHLPPPSKPGKTVV